MIKDIIVYKVVVIGFSMDIANLCIRLRAQIAGVDDALRGLRTEIPSANLFELHLINRLQVARDNALGCSVLGEHGVAAPLTTVSRSLLESLIAIYWASLEDKNANVLLDAMNRELLRIMRLNLERGHAEIRHKETGALYTQEILDDPKLAQAKRPPQFRTMAEQAGLGKLYDTTYGFESLLAHGTAPELLVASDQRRLISTSLHSSNAMLRGIHLIVDNHIRGKRRTLLTELQSILKVPLV